MAAGIHKKLQLLTVVLLSAVLGCKPGPPSTQPASTKSATPTPAAQLTLLTAGWDTWTRDQAVTHLAHEQAGVSAAVRLIRLAEVAPLCVPAELTDAIVAKLRLTPIGDDLWVLGLADRHNMQVLHAPVLISTDGDVQLVGAGVEEELTTLHVSPDADIFPHLLISPRRVWLASLPLQAGLQLSEPPTVGFAARQQDGYTYIGLMHKGEAGWNEVARYQWDPYELGLAGPAMDALPDPPGGKYKMDMNASPLLIPMGGEIPQPEPLENTPPPDMQYEVGEDDA
ncbi:MAG: hypothetical protein ABIG44_13935 [Planctomycetota bacterium]